MPQIALNHHCHHIAEYFQAAAKDIKLTVGVYFFGMTCSMLGFGYLSDKYGRNWRYWLGT